MTDDGQLYAEQWIMAWNSGSLEAALELWTDDLEFESPLAAQILGSPLVKGKAAARAYWGAALGEVTDLHFDLISAYWDAEQRAVTILYRRRRGDDLRTAAEIVTLNDAGLGIRGIALHGAVLEA